jgi:hypothetical protein
MSYRHPTQVLHLDPHRPPRRWCIGPDGHPPLEAVVVPRRVRLVGAAQEAAGISVVLLVLMLLGMWLADYQLNPTGWVFAVSVVLLFVWRYAVADIPPTIVAGSDWVGAAGRRSWWVPLYELTRIDGGPARDHEGEPITGATDLTLWAASGQGLQVELGLLQANPALWDLVHQGLVASVASGAEVTEAGRQVLRRL